MLDILSDNRAIEIFVVLFLGLIFGSFSTAIIYRTRNNQSWVWNAAHKDKGRSFCPSCRHTLGLKDLVPVFSWLFQRGRCRYCKVKIPLEYPLFEITLLLICFLLYGSVGFTSKGLFLMCLSPFFVSQGILLVKYNVLSKLLLLILIVGGGAILFL